MSNMSNIPILYINLDHRKDRKEHMEQLLNGKNYYRIPAIYDTDNGYIGCVKSHIKCLEFAKTMNFDRVVILEDDFVFKGNNNFNNMILPKCDYDILLLCNLVKDMQYYNDDFNKVKYAEWTSGHIVKCHMYDILIKNLNDGMNHLIRDNIKDNYLDVYWNKLLNGYTTLVHKNIVAVQKGSYSDIKNCVMNRTN